MYLLDTNHCSFIFVQKDADVLNRLASLPQGTLLAINTIIYGELRQMAEKSQRKAENLGYAEAFVKQIKIYPIDEDTAKIYGQLSATIFNHFAPKKKNKRRKFTLAKAGIRVNDLWIACTAVQHNLTIVSEDRDFKQIDLAYPLQLECWKKRNC